MFAAFCERKQFTSAVDLATSLVESANQIYPPYHIEKAQLFEQLAQISIQANLPDRAQTYLSSALEQYLTYFGSVSSVPYQRVLSMLQKLDSK